MKAFIELFTAARSISTPLVAVRTFDASSTIQSITKSLGKELFELTPIVSWDSIHGMRGLNKQGQEAVADMCAKGDGGQSVDRGATVDLVICLAVLENATEDLIAFIHNPHLVWGNDKRVIQAEYNLRNDYKANGNMVINLIGTGDELPAELQQDVLVLEEPLPTRQELAQIVKDTFAFAATKKEYAACKGGATEQVISAAVDAGIGLPSFPFDQSVAMTLDRKAGKLDIETLWGRKKDIVSSNAGLSYMSGHQTLADMYGCEAWVKDARLLMDGKRQPTVIVRMDEIQRQLAGSESDSSGTKGNLMGEFLTWVNDHNVICTLNLGVSGTSKSWGPLCIAGEYGKPVVNYSVSAMEHKHVGESSRHMRVANKVLEAISDCKIWLIASANSLEGLPPELISRFQRGGIYFFDLPDEQEKQGILKLKIKAYNLDSKQEMPAMPNWTGRDIDNMCGKAELFGMSLVDAAQHIIPLHQSHTAMIENIRSGAANRFLSASKAGVYRYEPPTTVHKSTVVTTPAEGQRKYRD
jgi:hypothetical protein